LLILIAIFVTGVWHAQLFQAGRGHGMTMDAAAYWIDEGQHRPPEPVRPTAEIAEMSSPSDDRGTGAGDRLRVGWSPAPRPTGSGPTIRPSRAAPSHAARHILPHRTGPPVARA
jgi:hypothetical protein